MIINVHCLFDRMAPIGLLKEHPQNNNRHPQAQLDLYAKILTAQGWRKAIVVSERSGYIVEGHGALYAARMLRQTECPVALQPFESSEQELEHLMASNRLGELSKRDCEKTARLLQELRAQGRAVEVTGYDPGAIDGLLKKIAAKSAPAVKADREVRAGQTYSLGRHTLIVGPGDEKLAVKLLDAYQKITSLEPQLSA
jgi:hypothetical protein